MFWWKHFIVWRSWVYQVETCQTAWPILKNRLTTSAQLIQLLTTTITRTSAMGKRIINRMKMMGYRSEKILNVTPPIDHCVHSSFFGLFLINEMIFSLNNNACLNALSVSQHSNRDVVMMPMDKNTQQEQMTNGLRLAIFYMVNKLMIASLQTEMKKNYLISVTFILWHVCASFFLPFAEHTYYYWSLGRAHTFERRCFWWHELFFIPEWFRLHSSCVCRILLNR